MDPITQTKNQYRLEEWQAVIKGQRASGESIRRAAMEEKDGATTFVPVTLDAISEGSAPPAAPTAGIVIQTREATITIRDGASPETIQAVLKVMTASC